MSDWGGDDGGKNTAEVHREEEGEDSPGVMILELQ